MFKPSSLLIALSAIIAAGQVNAASIDFRHEYKGKSEQHSSRVKINESIGNFSISGELKFRSPKEAGFFEDLSNNGWELDLGYRFKINDNWSIQPGMPIEGRSDGMTYKPQLRATYAFDSIDGFSLSGRYRHDIKMYSDGRDTQNRHRFTGNASYKMDEWEFGLELNYYKAEGYELFDNKDTNYENNLTIRYRPGAWSPYIELGDVSMSSETDERELRSRVGISYSF